MKIGDCGSENKVGLVIRGVVSDVGGSGNGISWNGFVGRQSWKGRFGLPLASIPEKFFKISNSFNLPYVRNSVSFNFSCPSHLSRQNFRMIIREDSIRRDNIC